LNCPEDLWKIIEDHKERDWYSASVAYWDKQEASYDGVLGGYGHVSEPDIAESRKFLMKALAGPLEQSAAKKRRLIAIGARVLFVFLSNTLILTSKHPCCWDKTISHWHLFPKSKVQR
jgi:hypothetical protein